MKPREPGEQGPASLRGRVHNGVQGGSEQPQEKAQTGQKPGSFHTSRDIRPRASPSLSPHTGPEVPLWVLLTSLTEEGVGRGHHTQGQCCGASSASPRSGLGLLGVLAISLCTTGTGDGGTGTWLRVGTGTWGPGFCSCLQLSQGGARPDT